MRSPQPLAVVALSRRFDLRPAAAAVLVSLYRNRHPRPWNRLGPSADLVRVYISQIRQIMGAHAITCDYSGGYTLGDTARKEIRQALEELYAEVSSFLQPLLLADAA